MLQRLVPEPNVYYDLNAPGPLAMRRVSAQDATVLRVSGVLQCSAIFVYDRVTRMRLAAHFGGFGQIRRPDTADLAPLLAPILGEYGIRRIQVTICRNSSSPSNTQDQAAQQVQAIDGRLRIALEDFPGDRFFLLADGRVFGGGTPTISAEPRRKTNFLSSRGQKVDIK